MSKAQQTTIIDYDVSNISDSDIVIDAKPEDFEADFVTIKTKKEGINSVTLKQSATLTLLGNQSNPALINIVDGTNIKTNIETSGILNFGQPAYDDEPQAPTSKGKGRLNGSVVFGTADGSLNVYNGNYTVENIYSKTGAGTNDIGIKNASLTAKIIGSYSDKLNLFLDSSELNGNSGRFSSIDMINSNLTLTEQGNIIAESLNLGSSGTDGQSGGSAKFTKDLSVGGNISLYNGSILNVDTFTPIPNDSGASSSYTIGSTKDSKGSSFIINKLANDNVPSSTFFISSPQGDLSTLQIKSNTGNNNIMIASSGGLISFGLLDKSWVQQQLSSGNLTANSILTSGTPITIGAKGQLLIGASWDTSSRWGATEQTAPSTNALDVRGNSVMIFELSRLSGGAAGITLTSGNGNVNIDSTSSIRLYNDMLRTNQVYTLVAGVENLSQNDINKTLVDKDKLTINGSKQTNNILIGVGDLTYNTTDKSLKVRTVQISADSALPKVDNSLSKLIDKAVVNQTFDTELKNAPKEFIFRATDRINSVALAEATLAGASNVGTIAGTKTATMSAVSVVSAASSMRMSFTALPLNYTKPANYTPFAQPFINHTQDQVIRNDIGENFNISSGFSTNNEMEDGLGVWVQPFFQNQNTSDIKAGNFTTGSNTNLGGVIFGTDYSIDKKFRFGTSFNMGKGTGESGGDFNRTDNKFDFWGVNLYGGYIMKNFALSGDVGYTKNKSEVEQHLPSSMNMDNLKSDINSVALTAGIKSEYKIETQSMVDITPHIGIRYMNLTTDGYDVKSGGTIFMVDKETQSIWTLPIGLSFGKTFISDTNSWLFRPTMDLSAIAATGDIKSHSKSRIPGIIGQSEMKMQVVDPITFDGGLGIQMYKEDLSISFNYNIQASEHLTGHGIFSTIRYQF